MIHLCSSVLFTLAKQAKFLQANKLCLLVNKRLQSLKPPAGVQEQIDVSSLGNLLLNVMLRNHFAAQFPKQQGLQEWL